MCDVDVICGSKFRISDINCMCGGCQERANRARMVAKLDKILDLMDEEPTADDRRMHKIRAVSEFLGVHCDFVLS